MKTKFWTLVPIEREEKYKLREMEEYSVISDEEREDDLITFWEGLPNYKEKAQSYWNQLNGEEPTRFTQYISETNISDETTDEPEACMNVLYLGEHTTGIAVFKTWDKNEDSFDLYFGTLGNEDYKPFKMEQ